MGLTSDLQKGIVDRLKSLPIPRSSVLVGRSISSLIHSSIGIVVMAVTGLMIGWGINTNVLEASFAFVLLIVFGFSMIWLGIWVGSAMRSVEAVQGFMFTVMFPLTFVANTFAPTESMPPWLRTIAEWNPVSCLTQACRNLWGNGAPAPPDAAYPLHHPEIFVVLWAIVFTAVFAPTETMPAWLRTIAEWNPVSAVTQACRELWGNGLPAPADAAWPLQHAVPVSIAWSLILTAVFAPLAVTAFRRRSRD